MHRRMLLLGILLSALWGCGGSLQESPMAECGHVEQEGRITEQPSPGGGALVATRFASLEALKAVVRIDYFDGGGAPVPAGPDARAVRLVHCSRGSEVVGILKAGISQGDMQKAQTDGIWGQVGLVYTAPFAVSHRGELQNVIRLARRRPSFFHEGDAAFLDFAEYMVAHINTPEIAFANIADTSEKGYLNTFNHVTAQAFITSFYTEELADFVGDVHERHNMPELTSGIFSDSQLVDPIQNPIDNYVDMVNNEWGQELGKQLKAKYHISAKTVWTADLLANFLNDIQAYFSWIFQIGFQPFKPEEEVVFRFTQKINYVLNMPGMEG